MTRWEIFKHNCWQALVSIDQALHNLGGAVWAGLAMVLIKMPTGHTWADETLSSRCWRWHLYGVRSWPRKLVDMLFWWDKEQRGGRTVRHCELSYESERDGRQLPPELRPVAQKDDLQHY